MGIKYITSDGKEAEMSTPLIDALVEIVSGKKSSDRKALAVEILRYVAQKRAEHEAKEDFAIHAGAYHMMVEWDVISLWELSDTHRLQTIPVGGVDQLKIEQIKTPESKETPMPPIPTAIRLPVLAPSAEEQAAVREMAEKFMPAKVAARVAAIQEEAPGLKH